VAGRRLSHLLRDSSGSTGLAIRRQGDRALPRWRLCESDSCLGPRSFRASSWRTYRSTQGHRHCHDSCRRLAGQLPIAEIAVNVPPKLKERLQSARSVAVLTGAGISADSGVPTFRGQDGLWRNFRAEDLATPDAFSRDPRLVW